MTVNTTNNSAVFVGNGTADEFDYSFKVMEEDHLILGRRVIATGLVDKIYTPDEYTIDGIGEESGSVTLLAGPLSSDYELLVQRIVPITQELDIVNEGGFYPETVEDQLDRMVMVTQQLDEGLSRTLQVPVGEEGLSVASLVGADGMVLGIANGEIVPFENTTAAVAADVAAAEAAVYEAQQSAQEAEAAALSVFGIASVSFNQQMADVPRIIKQWLVDTGTDGAIWDPSFLDGMWQDTAGTTPALIGDTVDRMDDFTEGGLNMLPFGAANATLEVDENGQVYLNCPATCYVTHSSPRDLNASAFIAFAASQQQQTGTLPMISFAADGAHGFHFDCVNNFSYGIMRLSDSPGELSGGSPTIAATSGSFPNSVPAVVDAQIVPGLFTSWINGSARSRPEAWGIKRAKVTTLDETFSIPDCYFGINWQGNGGTDMATRFYAGVWINGVVDSGLRKLIHNWMRWRAGHFGLDIMSYDGFILAGQSNVIGVGDRADSPLPLTVTGGYWTNYGYIAKMADPVNQMAGDLALSGSAWPQASDTWFSRSGNSSLFIGCAVNGAGIVSTASALGSWGDGGGLVELMAERVLEAVAMLNGRLRIRGLIYEGGEQDVSLLTAGTISVADYADMIVDIRDRSRVLLNMPTLPMFLLSPDRRVSGADNLGFTRLRDAFVLAAAADAGMELAMPYQDFVGDGFMTDDVHWDQEALNIVGETAMENIADYFGYVV